MQTQSSETSGNEIQLHVDYLKSELRKMQSLAALGELTGTATHEFNNILMTILNSPLKQRGAVTDTCCFLTGSITVFTNKHRTILSTFQSRILHEINLSSGINALLMPNPKHKTVFVI